MKTSSKSLGTKKKNWTIEFLPSALEDLRYLHVDIGEKTFHGILQEIAELREDPTPEGSIHMQRTKNFYRIRVEENHRVIYRVDFGHRRILVAVIRARGEAYRGWEKWGRID